MTAARGRKDAIRSVASILRSRPGLVIVVSAPSGAGKTSVCERLLEKMPDLRLSISYTTRPRRKGEIDGKHYHFVKKKRFLEERDRGLFVEWAEVFGHYYGTPRDFLDKRIRAGKDTLLDIDVQGARSISESFPEAVRILLLPPSRTELEKRLKGRGSDPTDVIKRRLNLAVKEFSCYPVYDYLVVNEDIDEAVEDLKAIVMAERCAAGRIDPGSSENTK